MNMSNEMWAKFAEPLYSMQQIRVIVLGLNLLLLIYGTLTIFGMIDATPSKRRLIEGWLDFLRKIDS
jgi:hypothetical protein